MNNNIIRKHRTLTLDDMYTEEELADKYPDMEQSSPSEEEIKRYEEEVEIIVDVPPLVITKAETIVLLTNIELRTKTVQ